MTVSRRTRRPFSVPEGLRGAQRGLQSSVRLLAKSVVTMLGDDLSARVHGDAFIVPASGPLNDFFRQPLAYDWDLLKRTLALSLGATAWTPGLDFNVFQRTPDADQRPFPIRPVMVVDAMYPYPAGDLTILIEAPDTVRRSRIVARDAEWNSTVAAHWHHLELCRQELERSAIAPDLRLSGERPLAANAAAIANLIQQRLR